MKNRIVTQMKRIFSLMSTFILLLSLTGCQGKEADIKTQSSTISDAAFQAGTQAVDIMQQYMSDKMSADNATAQLKALSDGVPNPSSDLGNWSDGLISIYILGCVSAISENELHKMGEQFAMINSLTDAVDDLEERLYE
ncbi:MAG: hypothetical protein PHY64_01300 [Eubacteriales bacterium]|nr:hypothetical protein [Eubacteriales bacterium]